MLEYSLLVAAIVVSLLAMQAYLKRSMQGKLKEISDDLGQQYNPENTTSDMNYTFTSDTQTASDTYEMNYTNGTGIYEETVTNTTIYNETQVRQGTETVGL